MGETIDVDILSKPVDKDSECTELCHILCLFVVEARKTNGEPYPPKTVFHLLAGLLHYARSGSVQQYPNFLDPKDVRFRKLQGTMDNTHFRKLQQAGVGAEVKHSGTISPREEDLFWELGILGTSTPLALLRSVFYYDGKVFCLRGGDEQRQLKFSQLKRVSKGYIYVKNGSKNCSGVAQMKIEPSYASTNTENKERCHVYLLDLYMEKVPKGALSKGAFYLHPVAKVCDIPGSEWYTSIPVRKNMLQKMLPTMCEEAGITRQTNHSLRATGATDMFHANIPEKVIQSRTGHLSLKALRMYENPTDEQHSAACSVLVDRRSVTPPEVLKPTQPLAGPVPSTMVQASITTHDTSVVPSTLFGSA